MPHKAALTLKNVSFSFGKTEALSNLSMEVAEGSFTTILGPSGCGKTTLLRLIAGFLSPATGKILVNGENIAQKSLDSRGIGMVFQDYALFPHLSVRQNMEYGLKIKRKGQKEHIAQAIQKMAKTLGLSDLLSRFPHEISGGQQQRVALGRALVLEPTILLMDEPLSNLDAKLRTQVREELKDIQSSLGITTIYVTHDQEEALSLSDRIFVLNHGKLQQEGTPQEIYYEPKNAFVADFIGKTAFLKEKDGTLSVVRPEWLSISPIDIATANANAKDGTIKSSEFLGSTTRYRILSNLFEGGELFADVPSKGAQKSFANETAVRIDILHKWHLAQSNIN